MQFSFNAIPIIMDFVYVILANLIINRFYTDLNYLNLFFFMSKIKNTQKHKQNPHKYKRNFPDVSLEKCYERGKYFYIKQYDYSKNY